MSRGERDFKVNILSDVDETGMVKGAEELEQLGDEASKTARKVDNAFERIATSSRSNLRKVDDDADHARKGLDELGDEAASTGKEAAASFSGSMDDIAGAIQEVTANAFAGFGPAGMVAGLAAAAGIGTVLAAIEASKERISELRDALVDLDTDGATELERISAVLDLLRERGDLENFRKAARNAGIDWRDFVDGMGGDTSKIAAVKAQLDAVINSDWRNFAQLTDQGKGAQILYNALTEVEKATSGAKVETEAYTEAIGASIARAESYADAIGQVSDGSSVMADAVETAAQRQADATKDAADSAEDYRDTVLASIDDVIAKQLEQLTAAEDFQANTAVVLARLGQDAVDWALSQGENADRAMQLMATAPLAKAEQVVANYRRVGQLSSEGYSAGMTAGQPSVAAAATATHAKAAEILGRQIEVPTMLKGVSDDSIWSTRRRIIDGLGTITVPLMLQNVTPSIWSTQRRVP